MQMALAVLGISIGVGAAVAMDLAVGSARAAFRASMQALLGPTTHQLVASRHGIQESLYPALLHAFPEIQMRPVVEGIVQYGDETFRLAGFDVFAGPSEDRGASYAGVPPALPELLLRPGTVLMSAVSMRQTAVAIGQSLALKIGGRMAQVKVVGTIEGDAPTAAALEGVLLADIATAQEILGKIGVLDRVDLVLPDDPAWERRLAERLPPAVRIVSAGGRTRDTARLSSAFETNLHAMSLLGLVVGLFLIYNTMTFAVLQRRDLIAGLRLLGVTRGEVMRGIFGEALLLGLVGSAVGLLLGIAAAGFLIERVTQTINDMYFTLTVRQLTIAPAVPVQAFALGLATSVLGAMLPAREAAGTHPLSARSRSHLELNSRRLAAWAATVGAITIACSLLLLFGFRRGLVAAISELFLLIAGCGLTIPALAGLLARPMKRWGSCFVRLAVAQVSESLSRTGVAIAALAIAFAVALGVEVMTDSFRVTVEDWLRQLMQSDLYLAADPDDHGMDAAVMGRVAAIPGVAGLSVARKTTVESHLGPLDLMAFQPGAPDRPGYRVKGSDPGRAWSQFFADEAVLVSEPLASRHRLQVGDALSLVTAAGEKTFRVAGIVYDYRSDRGIVLMRRPLYLQHWQDDRLSSVGLLLADGVTSEQIRDAVKVALGEVPGIQVRSQREIRDASMAVFDRTFAVTGVLRLLAASVALVGLIGSLLALHLERLREFAILRALGMTPRQLAAMLLLQSGYIGSCAGLLAVPLGLLLAWVLVRVIQSLSFGWSMELTIPVSALWRTPIIGCAAAMIAGAFPAWRAGRSTPLSALREE